ncbi:MAG: lipoyl(octanoyl) transferase [Proteobacteria bacterium]|nr:lipoyl(octanoyl) transferase [Pseudomonadota bacterium]
MIRVRQLGLIRYSEALSLMEQAHAELAANPDALETLLIVEHPPVVTMGLRERTTDLVTSESQLDTMGIDFRRIDRGGSVTVHEPGQLVLYPLIRVDARFVTVRKLVWALEEIMIRECARWGLEAARDDINPGVWVGRNKIGAVGVRVSNHVSKHGLAINVQNNLETFGHIIPCGIQGRGVTSLQRASSHSGNENLPLIGERMAADFIKMIEDFRCPPVAVQEPCTRTVVAPL